MAQTKTNSFVQALEGEAVEQLDAIREFRAYKGTNPDYHKRAKMAIGVIGAYVRLRATMANEKSNELIERRMLGGGPLRAELPSVSGEARA